MRIPTVLLLYGLTTIAIAQPQESMSFRLTKSVIDAGGTVSTSPSFQMVSAFGQPTPIGIQTSSSFTLYAGFLAPAFASGDLNPIDSLVIQRAPGLSTDMRLIWSPVPGAASYKIYRSTNALFVPTPETLIGTSAANQFDDVGAINLVPVKHFYVVTALDAAGILLTPLPLRPRSDVVTIQKTAGPKPD